MDWGNFLLFHLKQFYVTDVSSILSSAGKALQKLSFPSSIDGILSLTTRQKILLAPTLTAILYFTSLPLIMLYRSSRNSSKNTVESYWKTRVLLIKMIGLIYLSAFLTLAFQSRALYGENGVFSGSTPSLSTKPTPVFDYLEYYFDIQYSDVVLESLSWLGVFLSLCMILDVFQSFFIPLTLWLTYLSIVNMGTNIRNYGWEWLTLEIGFLAIFLMPIFSKSKFPRYTPPSYIVILLYRWIGFRLLFGAGMSKLGNNASKCWFDLTCTTTHYYTQPMPNLFAWFAHYAPDSIHHAEVFLTLFEQLVLPFGFLVPVRSIRIIAGIMEIFLQLCILATGNYAWINFAGILPCITLFDDQFLSFIFTKFDTIKYNTLQELREISIGDFYRKLRVIIYILLLIFIVSKSTAPVKEMFSDSPWLKTYDDYYFVTAQGLFGFINQHRVVLHLEYTHDDHPDWHSPSKCFDSNPSLQDTNGNQLTCSDLSNSCNHNKFGETIRASCKRTCGVCSDPIPLNLNWKTLEYKNLPGSLDRTPWFNSPIHYRFDWEVWIHTTARMESARFSPLSIPGFIEKSISKILAGDTDTIGLYGTSIHDLLDQDGNPPKAIKGVFYLYTFSSWNELQDGIWWNREVLPSSKPKLFTQRDKWIGDITISHPNRNWMIFFIVLGMVLLLKDIIHSHGKKSVALIIIFMLIFLEMMRTEYFNGLSLSILQQICGALFIISIYPFNFINITISIILLIVYFL